MDDIDLNSARNKFNRQNVVCERRNHGGNVVGGVVMGSNG